MTSSKKILSAGPKPANDPVSAAPDAEKESRAPATAPNDDETETSPPATNGIIRAEAETACCGNCAYYFPTNATKSLGQCRINPPTPILIGMIPPRLEGQAARPVVDGFFAPTAEGVWCHKWDKKPTTN